MIKVLLIGNGAREHAVAEAIRRSPQAHRLFSYMKSNNPGIRLLSEKCELGDYRDLGKITAFAKQVGADFCFVGPEAPLDFGAVDALAKIGVPSVGPVKELAKLETSKAFAHILMEKHRIPGLPKFGVFKSTDGVKEFLLSLDSFVVKPDGLTGGKGVMVHEEHLKNANDALKYCEDVLKSHASVIIEEKLEGEEFSLQSFTDGRFVLDCPPAQDHKRAYENDEGPNCYSEDTEILTEDGWKTFDKLKNSDKVATFDPKSKFFRFEKSQKIHWRKYSGKMIQFRNRNVDLLVTPNHKMLFQQRRRKKKVFVIEAKNYKGENYIYQACKWNGEDPKYFVLPEHDYKFNRKLEKTKINFKDWVGFLALFLSEGYIVNTKEDKRVYICQTEKSKNFKMFVDILEKLPFKFNYEKHHKKFRINSLQLVNYLEKFGKSQAKYVPNYIKNATENTILEFLKAFCLGDGDIHYGQMRFCSSSKRMIDDLQEMIIRICFASTITVDKRTTMINPINRKRYPARPVYSTTIRKTNKTSIRKNNVKEVNYEGYIGCVTVSTGFVIVRRKNKIVISGNTGGMGSYSCADHMLPFMRKSDLDDAHRITELVAKAIAKETGTLYKGVMYGGFMVTRNGVKLLEYNARLGDPETMNVLPILSSDFIELCLGVTNGALAKVKADFEKKATVCKYVVPQGYPDNPVRSEKIEIAPATKAKVYYASVDQRPDGLYMSGSRAVAFVGISGEFTEAERIAEEAVKSVKGKVFHRPDIGTKPLLDKRVRHMQMIRGKDEL
jgi:phosphoribosylamine-glycine ligase